MKISTHDSIQQVPFSAKTATGTEGPVGKMSILTQGNLEIPIAPTFHGSSYFLFIFWSSSIVLRKNPEKNTWTSLAAQILPVCFSCLLKFASFPIAFPSRIP